MLEKQPHFSIGLGFAAVWVLMTVLAVVVLISMATINQHLEAIVSQHNVKTTAVASMREAIRKRQIILRNIFIITDVFDREEERLKFYALAQEFVDARDKFSSMPLDEYEQATFTRINALARIAYPLQNELIDLALTGTGPEKIEVRLQNVFATQSRVIAQLNSLLDYQRNVSRETGEKAVRSYNNTRLLIIVLGGIAAFLNLLIAAYVVHRTKVQARKIQELAKFPAENPTPVLRISNNGTILYANAASKPLLDDWCCEVGDRVPDHWRRIIENISKPGTSADLEIECQKRIFSFVVTPVPESGYVNLYGRDITERERMKRKIAYQASHDTLTGLINRREFETRLEQLRESALNENKDHALLFLDLDQFKVVNDTGGHIAGDQLLKQLSVLLKRKIRGSDTLARLGGDEFGVLLIGCPLDRARNIADMLRQTVKDFHFSWQGKTFNISVSIGIVPITAANADKSDIMSDADLACYAAKDHGRNRVHIYKPSDIAVAQRKNEMQWIHRIQKALDEQRFRLYYQTIMPLSPRATQGIQCEILLRMVNRRGKLIPPMAFIPAAERYNLMPAIDRWVINSVLDVLQTQNPGVDEKPLSCSINLSGQSIGDSEFLNYIVTKLKNSKVDPQRICFEITETAAIADLTQAMHLISTLKSMGCRFALDDFGSGLSSFSYLKNLNVDYLKIDGSFVKKIVEDPIDRAMVEAINRIGHEMGIQTIAEFVENDAILEKLKELGVDYAQGYGIEKPKPLSLCPPLNVNINAT